MYKTNQLLTVVIPAYNASQTLERAINSILKQPAFSSETDSLLIVDDGSKDFTAEVSDALALQNPEICIIHKPNAGVSSARNMGIAAAYTKYIAFLDSDDWWVKDFFDEALKDELTRKDSSDVYLFSQYSISEYFGFIKLRRVENLDSRDKKSTTSFHTNDARCIYRLRHIQDNRILFPNIKHGEDGCFSSIAIGLSSSVTQMDRMQYAYWMNPKSCLHNRNTMTQVFELVQRRDYVNKFLNLDHSARTMWDRILVSGFVALLPDLCASCSLSDVKKIHASLKASLWGGGISKTLGISSANSREMGKISSPILAKV